jgi:Mg-chelatase subunit ChlD
MSAKPMDFAMNGTPAEKERLLDEVAPPLSASVPPMSTPTASAAPMASSAPQPMQVAQLGFSDRAEFKNTAPELLSRLQETDQLSTDVKMGEMEPAEAPARTIALDAETGGSINRMVSSGSSLEKVGPDSAGPSSKSESSAMQHADGLTVAQATDIKQFTGGWGKGSAAAAGAGGLLAEATGFKDESPMSKPMEASKSDAKAEAVERPLQDAQNYYASGRYDLANKRYAEALAADKNNIEAKQGMEKIEEARAKYKESAFGDARGNASLLASANGERPVRKFNARDSASSSAPVLGDVPIAGRELRSDGKDRSHAFQTEISTAKQPFSTFSLHVSDVSFQLAKDALAKGAMPDPDRIRAEEFYNAFDYNDPSPAPGEEVACRIEQCAHPFVQQRDLVRIALKVAAAGRAAGQSLRLTILLDTSGSMEREDRAASIRKALGTLAALLGPNDRVTLIGFARTPRLLAEQVPGDQAGKLVEIAARTPSEGGTNLEQALALASEQALKQKLPSAQNRIVLLTDGAANLGNADPVRLARQIEKTRQQGISFDACGVGANGLNDEMLEALTRKGDGRYYFLNRPEDADAGFARQLAGALRPSAENVKVQVVFNPARVSQYRLVGFEKHLLKKEDFRNDKVQAAELSAEEAGVAVYQVQTLPEGEGELGEVFVRFRDPANGMMVERSWVMPYDAKSPAFDQAPPSMQLAATAALLAEKLRGDSQVDLDKLAPVITNLRGRYPHQAKVGDLIRMYERMRR